MNKRDEFEAYKQTELEKIELQKQDIIQIENDYKSREHQLHRQQNDIDIQKQKVKIQSEELQRLAKQLQQRENKLKDLESKIGKLEHLYIKTYDFHLESNQKLAEIQASLALKEKQLEEKYAEMTRQASIQHNDKKEQMIRIKELESKVEFLSKHNYELVTNNTDEVNDLNIKIKKM